MAEPKFYRMWSMPSSDTFSIPPIRDLIGRYIRVGEFVDPFARNSPFKEMCLATNDLCAGFGTTHNMESLDFLRSFDDCSVGGVLFDPPYSPRQISECYKSVGREVHMEDTQSSFYGDRKKEVARVVRVGGVVICCGWNSGGIGETLGFELVEVLLVPHGGAHNDTIVTVEVKRSIPENGSLFND